MRAGPAAGIEVGETHWTAELRYMLLFLCLDAIGDSTAGGFSAFAKDEEEAKKLGELYRDLRANILEMSRAAIGGMEAAREDREKIKV